MLIMLTAQITFGGVSAFGIAVVAVPFGIYRGAPLTRLYLTQQLYLRVFFLCPSGSCRFLGNGLSLFRRELRSSGLATLQTA